MSHQTAEKPHQCDTVSLEPYLNAPNGGQMARCQAHKKSGEQCGAPAVQGKRVCSKHGAGTAARPGGRPVEHGLYSKAGMTNVQDLMEKILASEADLDSTDRELAALKAVLWHLLEQAPKYEGYVETLEQAMKRLDLLMDAACDEQEEPAGAAAVAREIGGHIRDAGKVVLKLDTWSERLMKSAEGIIDASKKRAETKAKLAETKALEHFVKLLELNRNIIWDLLDEDQIDVFEDRLAREIGGPNRLTLPPRVVN